MIELWDLLELRRPVLGLDLETTGVDAKSDSIVELGLQIIVPGQPVKEYRTLINPGRPIPPGATAVHGITNEMVRDAPRFKQLAPNLITGMVGCDFAGYNLLSFDLPMLGEEFARIGYEWDYEEAAVLDGFRLWQVVEGRTLEHAVNRWLGAGAPAVAEPSADARDRAHGALWDVRMSTRVIASQLAQNAHIPRDPAAIHKLLWPDRYDALGKLKWRDGELVFTFGAHKDKTLRSVPPSYLRWILSKDFSKKVKTTVEDAMQGRYPSRPVEAHDDPDPVDGE